MGNSIIIRINDNKWDDEIVSIIPKPQLHFLQSYHILLMKNGDGSPCLFKYYDNDEVLLIPFLIKRIQHLHEKEIYDIKSVFGYTGPISNSKRKSFLKIAFKAFNNYCISNNIISELVRFNPIINNHNIIDSINEYEKIAVKPYVVLNLKEGINVLKQNYKNRLRTYINKAERDYGFEYRINH